MPRKCISHCAGRRALAPNACLCAAGVERRGVGGELCGKEPPHTGLEPRGVVLERAGLAQQRAEVAPAAKLGDMRQHGHYRRGVAPV
jgi:hypothetical protein